MSSDPRDNEAATRPVEQRDLEAPFRRPLLDAEHTLRIGIEVEHLPVDRRTGRALPYAGDRGVEAIVRRRAPRPALGASNLEPGAQTELSGVPAATLAEVDAELLAFRAELRDAAAEVGAAYLSLGLTPVSLAHEIEIVPKHRYRIMTEHLAMRGGPRALDMMRRTASVQTSLDFDGEEDAGRKLRLGLLAAPVAAAIFAHSPIAAGAPSGLLSERTLIWTGTDPVRSGTIRCAVEGEWSFARYVEHLLGVPTIFVFRDGRLVTTAGEPFAFVLAHGAAGGPATVFDWELHLTTIFADARLKGVVELRSCDAPPAPEAMAVPAFWTGLLYHRPSREAALELLAPLAPAVASPPAYDDLKRAVARDGLRARLEGARTALDLARELVPLATAGLRARGHGEERYLAPVEATVAEERTPAERLLERWVGDVSRLVSDLAI